VMVSVSAKAITGMRSKETERAVRHFYDSTAQQIQHSCHLGVGAGVGMVYH
jgi:hypothetical protein